MADTPFGSDPDSYGAKLRAKGVQIDAGQAKSARKGKPESNARYNGWEKGIPVQHRPNGTAMPYLDGNGGVIRNKAFADGKLDGAKKALQDLRSGAVN